MANLASVEAQVTSLKGEPVPLIIRLASAMFCFGFVVVFCLFLGLVNHFSSSLIKTFLSVLLRIMIAVFAAVGVFELLGVNLLGPLRRR